MANDSSLELCSCQVPGKTWQQYCRSAGKRRFTNIASKVGSPESWCMPWRWRLCRRRCTDTGVHFRARKGRWCSMICRCRSALIPSLCKRQQAAAWRKSNGLSTADVQHRVNMSLFSAAIVSSFMIAIADKSGHSTSTIRSIALTASLVDIQPCRIAPRSERTPQRYKTKNPQQLTAESCLARSLLPDLREEISTWQHQAARSDPCRLFSIQAAALSLQTLFCQILTVSSRFQHFLCLLQYHDNLKDSKDQRKTQVRMI